MRNRFSLRYGTEQDSLGMLTVPLSFLTLFYVLPLLGVVPASFLPAGSPSLSAG